MKYYYDFHIHSCLSPCGDDDSTPNNIAGMGVINGLNIMALTDHNSCKNCPAFFTAAKRQGIIPIAGMELTTAEEVHIVCLFDTLEKAIKFGEEVDKRRIKINNKPEIFGEQLILDENDEVIGKDEHLLINATTISIDEAYILVKNFGGICYPAHIDRDSNGIIAMLGVFPESPDFKTVEIYNKSKQESLEERFPVLKHKKKIFCSDAHYLEQIRDKENYFELDENLSPEIIRKTVIEILS